MPQPLFTPRKDPVPIVQEAGWTPGPFWTGAENLAPTGIRSLDRPARSQSLYRLRYQAYTSKIHSNIMSCLLLHVSAKIHHLNGVYTPIFKTHQSIAHYNNNIYHISVISEAEIKNVKIL